MFVVCAKRFRRPPPSSGRLAAQGGSGWAWRALSCSVYSSASASASGCNRSTGWPRRTTRPEDGATTSGRSTAPPFWTASAKPKRQDAHSIAGSRSRRRRVDLDADSSRNRSLHANARPLHKPCGAAPLGVRADRASRASPPSRPALRVRRAKEGTGVNIDCHVEVGRY